MASPPPRDLPEDGDPRRSIGLRFSEAAIALIERGQGHPRDLADLGLALDRAEQIPPTVLDLIARRLEPWVADQFVTLIPRADVRLDAEPLPPGLVDMAELYRACRILLDRRTRGIGSLAGKIETRLANFYDAVRGAVGRDDMPDLQPMAMGLLRIEVLHTLLEDAGCRDERTVLVRAGARLARDMLRRVNQLMQSYLDDPPALQSRVDFAGVATRFDDLIVIVSRVFEASAEAERDTFVRDIGSTLLLEFEQRLSRLIAALTRAAETLRGSNFRAASYQAVLLQLERIAVLAQLLAERKLTDHAADIRTNLVRWIELALKNEHERKLTDEEDTEKTRATLRLARAIGMGDRVNAMVARGPRPPQGA